MIKLAQPSEHESSAKPWLSEPDFLEFKECGLYCVVLRHPEMGHLNCYVGVGLSHPWYKCDYMLNRKIDIGAVIDAHHRLTFSGRAYWKR